MRASLTTAFLASILLLGSCGDSAKEVPSDPVSALEMARSSEKAKEWADAEAAYQAVTDNADATTDQVYNALSGLGYVQARSGNKDGAMASFNKMKDMDQFEIRGAKKITDGFIRAGDAVAAESLLTQMSERFKSPTDLTVLASLDTVIKAAASGDTDTLAELGYAGD